MTEAELASEVGWSRAELGRDEATVSGASTYRHLEMMFRRASFADFVIEATRLHTLASLGVVGLACKTSPTVGQAMMCHQRYQVLTNRTAHYAVALEGGLLAISENRFGQTCFGSQLVSDYTMFIAVQLLRLSGGSPVVHRMQSRRSTMPEPERKCYEAFIEAPIELESEVASLVLDASILSVPIPSADSELATYLQKILERGSKGLHLSEGEAPLLREVRGAVHRGLHHGAVTAAQVAKTLGLGQRTLQRRLAGLGVSFAEVLDSTRRSLAETYLAQPELSLGEIAYLLGYSEQASFHRAFRRWTDMTPTEFRQTNLSSGAC